MTFGHHAFCIGNLINGNIKYETFCGVNLYGWLEENHFGKILLIIKKGR